MRHSCIPATIALLLFTAVATPQATSSPSAVVPRLRPQGSRVAGWLARGLDQSATLRALVARIEASDVIVFLETRRTLGTDVAACLSWMTVTPHARYVRATIRADLTPRDTLAMIAHELQHVVEVIDEPLVTSEPALVALYQRIGHRTGWTGTQWETRAAQRTGAAVRLEVAGV